MGATGTSCPSWHFSGFAFMSHSSLLQFLGKETGTNFNKSECWLPCKSRRESKVLSIREQSAWGFAKTAEEEAQCWVTASIGFWRLSCVKPKPHFLREGLWGEAVKCHLILSSDKTMRRNFAKLCTLNFFLLDVSLSFITTKELHSLQETDLRKITLLALPSGNPLSEIVLHPLCF